MNFITLLKEDKNSRKIFGRRELKIIEKQLFGVNLTQSEKNRLSRDIRAKFEFISKVSKFEEEFKLKKGAEIKRVIEEAKESILDDELSKKIKEIILYGSATENKLTLRSDVDIAVKFDKINLKESTFFRKRISGRVNKKIDIQVYNHLHNKIKREINNKGVILYNENKGQNKRN